MPEKRLNEIFKMMLQEISKQLSFDLRRLHLDVLSQLARDGKCTMQEKILVEKLLHAEEPC